LWEIEVNMQREKLENKSYYLQTVLGN